MKKIFKVLAFGIMLAVLAVGAAVPSFAQEGDQKVKEDLYAKYNKYYNSSKIEERKMAVEAGKEYIQKFGENEAEDPLVPYFKENIPLLEKQIKEAEAAAAAAADAAAKAKAAAARADSFNKAVEGKNWQQAFTSGKDILANDPKFLDVYIILSTIGYDRAVEKNSNANSTVTTFNNETVNYAKQAIQMIKNNEESRTKSYGACYGKDCQLGNYAYNNKENALGWLNYIVGYTLAKNENKPQEALPYLYEATKYDSTPKKSSDVYNMIGEYYFNKVAELEKERQALRQSLNNNDNKKTVDLFTMQKGYADRGMDYYAKAYNIEKSNPNSTQQYKDYLLGRFNKLYTFRNNGKADGSEAYLASIESKTLPNPTTPVQPIIDDADRELLQSIEDASASGGANTTKPADSNPRTTPQPTKP